MAFINQHEDVRIVITHVSCVQSLVEFMHRRRHNGCFGSDQIHQLASGCRMLRLDTALPEDFFNLSVQIFPVRRHDDARIFYFLIHGK